MYSKRETKSGLLDFVAKRLLLCIICSFISNVQLISVLAVNDIIVIEAADLANDNIKSAYNDTPVEINITSTPPETNSNTVR